jgi:hypothetical protein
MTRIRLRDRPALHRRAIGLQRDQVVADAGNPLDQVLAGRFVPAVNRVGVVSHIGDPVRLDPGQGRGYIFAMPTRRSSRKDSPAKLAARIKRRWRIVLMRKTGEVLGTVETVDAQAAEKVAAIQFELDEQQQRRLLVQELA